MVFYQVFLTSLLQCTVTDLENARNQKYGRGCMSLNTYVRGCISWNKQKSQGKAVEVTLICKEENSKDFCLDFVQEFGPCTRFFAWGS